MSGDLEARLVVRRGNGFVLDAGLHVAAGTTTALLGPNGAGKSTVIAALAGLLRIDAGRIELAGRLLDRPPATFVPSRDRRVGVVFQDGLLFEHLTVLGNVAFPLRSRGTPRRSAHDQARGWLEHLGVADLADRRPLELSGGQAQRIALCRALAGDPALLLLDEPLSALDVQARGTLRHTLADHLSEIAAPRLLVTHDPIEAFLLADHVAIIEDGSITQTGDPDEIRLRPRTPYAAEVAGANLLNGTARAGTVTIDGFELHIANHELSGRVLLAIHPRTIALSRHRPTGSQRNIWPSPIERIEPLGDRVRLRFRQPLPITAEVTPEAVDALRLAPGTTAWLALKATEVNATPDVRS